MTYWYETPDDQKDSWHWMGLALSVASTIGLNRDIERPDISDEKRRQRRRLWWSCVMRDPIVSIGLRRAPRIKEPGQNVSMLTLEDFNIYILLGETSTVSKRCAIA